MAIYPVTDDDGRTVYVISSGGHWRTGCYESERAARYAFRFKDRDLWAVQDSVNPNGIITLEMLRTLHRDGLTPQMQQRIKEVVEDYNRRFPDRPLSYEERR